MKTNIVAVISQWGSADNRAARTQSGSLPLAAASSHQNANADPHYIAPSGPEAVGTKSSNGQGNDTSKAEYKTSAAYAAPSPSLSKQALDAPISPLHMQKLIQQGRQPVVLAWREVSCTYKGAGAQGKDKIVLQVTRSTHAVLPQCCMALLRLLMLPTEC